MSQWDSLIQQAGQRWNVDPRLIASVVQVESAGNPAAVSNQGAVGLGQQIPATARALGIDPTDPAQSIEGVAKLLDENLRRYGNPQDAILAYHGGTDQANWGPKTRNYLEKVSRQYGAPTVANTKAAPAAGPDAFEEMFGPRPSATNLAPTGATAGTDAFEAMFGPRPSTLAPADRQPPAMQPPATVDNIPQPPAPPTTMPGQAWELIQMLGAQGIQNANAVGRGINDALDAPSEWLASGAEASGLTGLLGKAGINMPTADQQKQINIQSRADYDARNPTPGIQGTASRIGGNLGGVMVPIAGAEAALVQGGNALARATNIAPETAAAIGNFVRGQGGLASRIGYNAAQGAAGGALLSGGQEGQSLGDSAALGAALGGAVPVVGGVLRGGANGVRAMIDPFTNAGQGRVAQNILQRMAGEGPAAADVAAYVPGSVPTLAQATRNPMVAAVERAAESRAPMQFGALKDQNNAARNAYLDTIRGNQQTLDAAIATRDAQALPLLDQALAGAQPANPQPVIQAIDGILATRSGQRPAVVEALNRVRQGIAPEGQPLQADVDQLYGVRQAINDQLTTVAGRDNSASQLASRELIQVRDALDDTIEQAAPGFRQYLQQYSELSRPVDAQRFLQGLDLTDQTSQRITLSKVKSQINRIERMRAAPGANQAKSIADDQIDALRNLERDLVRESNSSLGRSVGSNTFQNLSIDNLQQSMMPGILGRLPMAPESLGAALGFGAGGPAGAAIGGVAGRGLRHALNAQSPDIEARMIDLLLDPNTALRPANNGAGNALLRRLGGPAAPAIGGGNGRNNNR